MLCRLVKQPACQQSKWNKSFKYRELGFDWMDWFVHFAMVAFWGDVICTTGDHRQIKGTLPTLKKHADDMTKVGLPVNMHAVAA